MLPEDYLRKAAIAGEFAPQILVMTDPEYRILWVNRAAEKAFAPMEQLVGRPCYEAIEGRDTVCPHCIVARSHASGKAEEGEITEVAENGRPLHFLVQARPILGEDEVPVAWLEATVGTTSIKQLGIERKRLQLLIDMQEAEDRFASLAQVAPIGIGIHVANRWIWLNKLFAATFAHAPEELIGANPLDLVVPRMRQTVAERFEKILGEKSRTDIEDLQIIRKDGVPRTISTASTYCVYRGEDAIISVVRDVTEERLATAAKERANQDLKALNAIGVSLGRTLRLDQVKQESLRQAVRFTNADAAMIALLDWNSEAVELCPDEGFPEALAAGLRDVSDATYSAKDARNALQSWSTKQQSDRPDCPYALGAADMGSLLRLPLQVQEKTIGVLWLVARDPEAFGDVSEELLLSMSHEIAMAIANAQLFEQVEKRNSQLAALNSIATALSQSLDISEVLNIALDEMMTITQASAGAISLVDTATATVRLVAHRNVPDALYKLLREPNITDGWEARVIAEDHALIINDLWSASNTFPETVQGGLRSAVCVPLRAHEQTVAVLNLLSDEVNHFATVSEEFLLSVGSQIGLAVANARLFMEKADSEELYRDLFETIPDPVVLISLDGARILRCNRPFREQTGYSLADIEFLSLSEMIVADDRPKARAGIEALLADDALGSAQFEIRCINKQGQVRDILVHAVPYHAQDRLLGFQAIARDITEQKLLQAHLLHTEKLSALGQLVSGVAHELNNPLATIMLATELLLQDETDPTRHARLEAIIDQVNRSSELTEDLRLFARREEPHRELVDIRLLLERVQGLVAPAFRRENIELIMDLPEGIPPVAGDPHQLEQVALNLMTNALHAMEKQVGENTLSVLVETTPTPREADAEIQAPMVRIIFSDTGPGVSPEVRNRIFDPFHTSKPPGKGTGLGLSVSLGIAESHRGTLYLQSATRGATFVLELPQATGDEHLNAAAMHELAQDAGRPVDLGGMKVLVVDDEVKIVALLTDMLRASNCKVDGVSSAADALHKLTSTVYDVILCDIKMPLLQGTPGYAAIVQAYPGIAARMVLMSGDTASLETVQLLDSMRCPPLRKPFTYGQLVAVLQTVSESG